MRRVLVVAAAALCSSCVPTPEFYSVPEQHAKLEAPMEPASGEYVRAVQGDADTYFMRDVMSLDEGNDWRWTNAQPEIRLRLAAAVARAIRLEFTVPDATFKDTGPLKLAIAVNGNELDRPVFLKPGTTVYQQNVPDNFLKPHSENLVRISVLNPWIAKDGVRLGFLLHGVGFVDR